ncbi:MAG TPA: hypothetical protein VFR51_19650 [Pyrinomonadaceae bacterium]|nr:hypothetical protein [Pyrinomonadaceae bacterium]
MAHDRMTNDNLDRNMGRAGQEDDLGNQDFGRQTPGRNPNDQQTGQKGAGQKNKQGGLGAEEDDDFGQGSGSSGQMGRTPQGGQNR